MYLSSFIFKQNQVFNEEDNPSQKVVIVDEELDDIDVNDIGYLEGLPRLAFINKGCWNLKVANWRWWRKIDLTRNINQRKNQTFYKPIDVHSVIKVLG